MKINDIIYIYVTFCNPLKKLYHEELQQIIDITVLFKEVI